MSRANEGQNATTCYAKWENVVARYMDNTFGSFGRIFEGGIWVWVRIGAPMDPASSK